MKQRLLVMNGQRIVQTEEAGAWKNSKVDKAGVIPPGIYNLHTAQKADNAQRYEGLIVHTTDKGIFQYVGKGKSIVLHDREAFDKVPSIGSAKSITYDQRGKAVVTTLEATQSRSRTL